MYFQFSILLFWHLFYQFLVSNSKVFCIFYHLYFCILSNQYFYIYNLETKALDSLLTEGKQRLADFSPAENKVAYVYENRMHIQNLEDNSKVSFGTGEEDAFIAGAVDWVYEEEFSFSRAIHWSPDGSYLAYLKFDETKVKEFTYTDFHNGMYPEHNTFKYPKVGEENSPVSLHAFAVKSGKTKDLLTVNTSPEDEWHYLPRVQWTTEGDRLTAQRMNRHQSKLELLLFDLGEDSQSTLLKEENEYDIDVHDNLTFLPNGKEFIWKSKQTGYNHVYLYDMKKGTSSQITTGDWEVTNFYGLHDGQVYFQAAKNSPMRREVYVKSL